MLFLGRWIEIRFVRRCNAGGCLNLTHGAARAQAPTVTESVTGSAVNWTVDIDVTDNMTVNQTIYFFGVELSGDDIGRLDPAREAMAVP